MSSKRVEFGPDEPTVKAWERFFKDKAREQINEAVLAWPDQKSIVVDFFDLAKHDTNLSDHLLRAPYEALAAAAEAMKSVDVPGVDVSPGRAPFMVRVRNLPADARVGVNDIRMEHAGRLVQVNGLFQAVAPTVGSLRDGLFICSRCGNIIKQVQDEHLVLQEPMECMEDQGGCGREARFKLVVGSHRGQSSQFVNVQVAMLQEPPETIVGTRPPVRIQCFLEDDLCGTCLPSERVSLTAVVRVRERKVGNQKVNLFDFFLEVLHVEHEKRDYDEIEPTPEEIVEFKKLANSPDLMEKLVGSIAPTLYGLNPIKQAILMQLFGGVAKDYPDGRHIRGDIHMLVVGDPGVAKTELGKAAVRLSPRGHFVNALTATVAGVVGGVEKVEKSLAGEGWIYSAGIAPMAHRGFVQLDEADKATDENLLNALLEPLEQQTASLSKHGARGLMVKCEFALYAAANPKNGRFESGDKLAQIDFPRPFLDRMDLIFALPDVPDEARDARLVDMMLRTHAAGIALLRGETASVEAPQPTLEPEFLRRYIAYAKRTVFPRAPIEIRNRIKTKYNMQRRRRSREEDSPVGYSPRTVNTLTRLSEAAARMRLSEDVSDDDLDLAMDIYNKGWEQLATNERGELDSDRLSATPNFDQRETLRRFKQLFAEIQGDDGIRGDEAVAEAVRRGLERDTVVSAVGRWKKDGTLMEKASGRYVLTSLTPRSR